jgi:hypothetical protein
MVILKRKYSIKKEQKKIWIESTRNPSNDIRIKYRKRIKNNYKT